MSAMTISPAVRAELDEARRELADITQANEYAVDVDQKSFVASYADHMQAIVDVLAWVLGESHTAPISSEMIPHPTGLQLSREQLRAEDVVNGARQALGRSSDYARAVWATVEWVRFPNTTERPTEAY